MRTILLVIAATALLAACNTIQGMGRDMQSAGQAVEKGVRKTKSALFD